MPPLHVVSPLAISPPQKVSLGPTPLLLRTGFDYYSAWVAACQRDDLEGEKEAEENEEDLRSEPDEPNDMADFDDPGLESEGELYGHTNLSSPLSTPPSSPTLPPTRTLSAQSSHVVNTTFNVITPTRHEPPPTSPNSIPPLSFSLSATTNSPRATEDTGTEKKRKRSAAATKKNTERKDKKNRLETERRRKDQRLRAHGDAYVKRYLTADTVCRDFDVLDLEAARGGDTGKNGRRTVGDDVPATLESLEERGDDKFNWDGKRTTYITDRTNNISIACVGMPVETDGRPPGKTWAAGIERLAVHLENTRCKYESKLSPKDRVNRRGPYPGVSVGYTRGSGSKSVHNLKHKPAHQSMVDELVDNADSKRVVSFQSEALAAHFPKVYCDLKDTMEKITDHHPNVKPPFASHSVYPGCTFNLGPQTVTVEHVDPGNKPSVPCAITSLGSYDPDKGGHLYLVDLKLIIRFPPGSTILISSASIRHANLPIQPSETRYSVTQFCPGGLYRWVRHGFRPACTLSKAQRQAYDGDPEVRWRQGWDLLSTPQTLEADRWHLVQSEKHWLEEWNAKKNTAPS